MAEGGDVQAQNASQCENCDCQPATHYCKTCPGRLCEPCKVQHLQRKISNSHLIVLLRGNIQEDVIKDYGFCRFHPESKYEVCCKLCEVPVCARCLTKNHNGHVLAEIPKVYEESKKSMRVDLKDLDDIVLPEHDALLDDATQLLTTLKQKIEDLENEMKSHANTMTDMIQKIMQAGVKQMAKLSTGPYEGLQMQIISLEERILQLTNLKSDMTKLLDSDNMVELLWFRQENSIFSEMYSIPDSCTCSKPTFSPGKVDMNQLLQQFGAFTYPVLQYHRGRRVPSKHRAIKASGQQKKVMKSPKKTSTLKIDKKRKDPISTFCMDHDSLWAIHVGKKLIQYDLDTGQELDCIDFKRDFAQGAGLAILRTGNVLYTDCESKLIYEISPNLDELKVQKMCTTENHPTGLYLCRNDDILVCQVSQVKSTEDKTQEKGFIAKYSKTWNLLLKISHQDHKELFSRPYFVAENVNMDICVSDVGKQQVIVVNRDGKKRFSLGGTTQKFNPQQLDTDSLGNIVVADHTNACIYLFNKDGMYLSTIVSKLTEVFGLSVDRKDNLYELGFVSRKMKVYKYLEEHGL